MYIYIHINILCIHDITFFHFSNISKTMWIIYEFLLFFKLLQISKHFSNLFAEKHPCMWTWEVQVHVVQGSTLKMNALFIILTTITPFEANFLQGILFYLFKFLEESNP